MSETIVIELPDAVSEQVRRMAQAQGVSPADLVARLATTAAQSQDEAQAYFAARAARATAGAAARLFSSDRDGGDPPQPGDELA